MEDVVSPYPSFSFYHDSILIVREEGYMQTDPVSMAANVCNDLPWDQAYENALNLAHQSSSSFLAPVSKVAYNTGFPISYIMCEKDLVITPEQQRGFVRVAEEESGRKVDVVSLESGHCPNWSMPGELAEVIVGEVGRE